MVNTFQHAKHILEESIKSNVSGNDLKTISEALFFLEKATINKEILEETRLGKAVNEFRKLTKNEAFSRRAKELVKNWRKFLEPVKGSPGKGVPRLRPISSPLVLSASSSPCLPSTNGTAHKALNVNNLSKGRPKVSNQSFKPVSPAIGAFLNKDTLKSSCKVVQPKPSCPHSPLNGTQSIRPNGHNKSSSLTFTEGSAFKNFNKSPLSSNISPKEATTYIGHGPIHLKRKLTQVPEETNSIKRARLQPPLKDIQKSKILTSPALLSNVSSRTPIVTGKTNKVKTTQEIIDSLRSGNEKLTPNQIYLSDNLKVTSVTSSVVSEKKEPSFPKVETIHDEISLLLAQLPPLNDNKCDLEEDESLPSPRTDITQEMLESDQLPNINGYLDHEERWRRPEETLTRYSVDTDLLHILPYVNIDW